MSLKETNAENMIWYGENSRDERNLKEVPYKIRKLFRLAFGRYRGTPEHRKLAATLIAQLQDRDRWLFCSCRETEAGASKPILIPVERSFIHRHPQSSGHHYLCPYAVDRKTQLAITRSFRKVPTDSIFRMLQEPSRETADGFPEDHRSPGADIRRSRLAKLLFAIMDKSGLQERDPRYSAPTKQYDKIKSAAERFKLAANVPVRRVLCTDLSAVRTYLAEFDKRVMTARWGTHPRPHAILRN